MTLDAPIASSDPTLEVLNDGLLFRLDCGTWTATAQLEPDDLGLAEADVAAHYALGRKRLIPKSALDPIRQIVDRAQYFLERSSTGLPDGGRFVTRRTVPEVLDQLHRFRSEFLDAVETFLRDYPRHSAAMRPEWEDAARKAWKHAAAPGSEDDFVAAFLERVDAAYPTPEKLAKKFRCQWYTYRLVVGGFGDIDAEAIADEERARRERDEVYAADVKARIEQAISDVQAGYRARVVEAFQTTLDHIVGGRAITPAKIERLRRTMEHFRRLDVYGDEDLETMFRTFEREHLDHVDPDALSGSADLRQTFATGLAAVVTVASTEAQINPATGRLQRRVFLPSLNPSATETPATIAPETATVPASAETAA